MLTLRARVDLGGDGNEGVLHISQSSSIIGTSPSGCLVSYAWHSLGEFYPSAEKQPAYSTASADWATNYIVTHKKINQIQYSLNESPMRCSSLQENFDVISFGFPIITWQNFCKRVSLLWISKVVTLTHLPIDANRQKAKLCRIRSHEIRTSSFVYTQKTRSELCPRIKLCTNKTKQLFIKMWVPKIS